MNEFITIAMEHFSNLGYIGMFCGMFLSNSFVPFPSEIVMIPAGIFVATGNFGFAPSVLAGALGGICGSLFNYVLSLKLGRELLIKLKIAKVNHLKKSEKFFENYGVFSVLFGSVMPVIRQYISIPAGISKMKLSKFLTCISIGVSAWVVFLSSLGYFVGNNKILIMQILNHFNIAFNSFIFFIIGLFVLFKVKKWHKCRRQAKALSKKEVKSMIEKEVREEIKEEVMKNIKPLIEAEVKEEIKDELKTVLKVKSKKKKLKK